MKVYLVNTDLDDGYSVQIVCSSENKAVKCAEGLVKLNLQFDENFDSDRIWIEEWEVVE